MKPCELTVITDSSEDLQIHQDSVPKAQPTFGAAAKGVILYSSSKETGSL